MIRDAQHLTSAFKMDQERPQTTRRYLPTAYDDFDLRPDKLGDEEGAAAPLLFTAGRLSPAYPE